MSRSYHRPSTPGAAFFEAVASGVDAEAARAAADRAATLLVRGARASDDAEVAERVVRLADEEGLETLAELWSGAPEDSLAGALWRLYVLRSWVRRDPIAAATEFEQGRGHAQVARVLAGVAEPPGADEVQAMVDATLRGIATGDFADVLFRSAAFARVVAAGRAAHGEATHTQTVRMLGLAEALEHAGHLELAGQLG